VREYEVEQEIRAQSNPAASQPPEPQKPQIFWPELISAKQLLALPPDPTRWIWDSTLPVGGCSVLVSKPKVGKSTFAATLSICVARGIPFLGRNTQQSGVAYLSLDASLPEMAEVFIQLGLRDSDPVFIHAGAAPQNAVKWIVQRVTENGVRFVIVDTLQRLFRFQDLNDYSQVTNIMEPLLEAMRKQGCHVQFLHHAKKDASDDLDSAIGSTAIRGLAYAYLHLKRLPDSERRILRSDQRGGKNFSELAIGFNRDGWLEVQGTREDAEVDDTRPRIQELLAVNERMSEREIRMEIQARGLIVSKALRQMIKTGEVERTGKGRKGEPFQYSLSSTLLASSLNSLPGDRVLGEGVLGIESEGPKKTLINTDKMLFPKNRELNGKSGNRIDSGNRIQEHSPCVNDALRIFGGGTVTKGG
jgi:AAA domain